MNILFYVAGAIAIVTSIAAITRTHGIHAILYLVVSFVAISVVFYTLGAPFTAALEVITYAGAIMVLFMFAIMLLNPGARTTQREKQMQPHVVWIGSGLLSIILVAQLAWTFLFNTTQTGNQPVPPSAVGLSLFGTYLLGVELASMLLLAGLVGAYYLGKHPAMSLQKKGAADDHGSA
jgi:NADH-quinone oxidoreductase subunit J